MKILKFKQPYTSLEHTLIMLREQARRSVSFAEQFLPAGRMKPAELFDFLKGETVYINDPAGTELLQSMPTLFSENNVHGIYGAGDCDCFTLTSLACFKAKGYKDFQIVLVGRDKAAPVHIYSMLEGTPFDLTNSTLGAERSYPYRQILPVSLK